MTTPDASLLRAVRERLSKPENWTKEFAARDASGEPVLATEAAAVCYCIVGAAWRGCGTYVEELHAAARLADALGFENWEQLADWNDHPSRTHAEVLARLDAAIEKETP